MRHDYPILDFDPSRGAIIEPSRIVRPIDVPEHCVLCFFRDVIEKLGRRPDARLLSERTWECGSYPLYELDLDGRRLAAFHMPVGAPLAVGMLEELIALGCRKFIACGGAGVLDKEIAVGRILVPTMAVRDEGTSYHYLPPSREVAASPEAVAAIEAILKDRGIDYLEVKTWTTDAPYRETPAMVARRRAEGCLTVEMEAAAFFAVARFRGVILAQMLYAGDDVSAADWDTRDWVSRASVRDRLFSLAAEACLRL